MGRPALVPRVTEQVIDLILEGRLKPGDRIHQNELAKELGVSATPLREALHVLAGEGLLRFSRGVGAQVTPLTVAGIIESNELALALETAALRKSIPLLTDEDLDELDRILERIWEFKDPREWYPLTWGFYQRLLAPSGYTAFLELIRKSIFQIMLVLPLYAKIGSKIRSREPNLRTVLAACRRRDVGKAVNALNAFNRKACRALVALIQEHLEEERNLPIIS